MLEFDVEDLCQSYSLAKSKAFSGCQVLSLVEGKSQWKPLWLDGLLKEL